MPRGYGRRFAARTLLVTGICWIGLSGCTSTGWPGARTGVGPERGEEPWRIPAAAYPTQRLYRMRYQGPEGRLRFKLTLYLEDEKRFRMRAADGLGRKVWELGIDQDDHALWLDHRNRQYCSAAVASRLAVVPLARLPLVSLPRLLLGYFPEPPAAELRRTETTVRFRDARGQVWNGELAGGRLEWWTRLDGGKPVTWWRREGDESVFVDEIGDQQLRWHEVVRESLASSPGPLRRPESYRRVDCG